MKINYRKAYRALRCGEKLPRKVKKNLLGYRMSQSLLNRLLKCVKVNKEAGTMYDIPDINTGMFCPNCGCSSFSGTGNMAEYPEHWENFFCWRCKSKVAEIDNSPFIHVLEQEGFSFS